MSNFGRYQPDKKEHQFEVPPTATVKDVIQLFRQNGASSWLADCDICAKVGIRLPSSSIQDKGPFSKMSPDSPYYDRSKRPQISEEDLNKNAIVSGAHSGSWEFYQLEPGACD